MTESLRDLLPPIYEGQLPPFFDAPAVAETRATCGDCVMCDKGEKSDAPAELKTASFRPDVKCCSYHPTLPNYLVGAALADETLAVGRARLRTKIAARVGVTPQWLASPRKYLVLLEAARESSFGRSPVLRCPYFEVDGGTCSIWRHREAVCTTFFCKHTSGASGHTFWTTLRRYLVHAERALARHAAKAVAPELIEPDFPRNRLTPEDLADLPPPEDVYAQYWGAWIGREAEFYGECASRVRALGRDELARLVNDDAGQEILAEVMACYERTTQPKLARRLALNPDMLVFRSAGGVGVTTYSRYDSLLLTDALYDALVHFSGDDPVQTVLERLRTDLDVDLPEPLLLQMQQFGVVREVAEKQESSQEDAKTRRKDA
jgi:hypothetical protein